MAGCQSLTVVFSNRPVASHLQVGAAYLRRADVEEPLARPAPCALLEVGAAAGPALAARSQRLDEDPIAAEAAASAGRTVTDDHDNPILEMITRIS